MTASQTFWTILLDAVLSSFGTIILFLLTWEWGKALLSPVLSALYYPIFHILEKRLTPPQSPSQLFLLLMVAFSFPKRKVMTSCLLISYAVIIIFPPYSATLDWLLNITSPRSFP